MVEMCARVHSYYYFFSYILSKKYEGMFNQDEVLIQSVGRLVFVLSLSSSIACDLNILEFASL